RVFSKTYTSHRLSTRTTPRGIRTSCRSVLVARMSAATCGSVAIPDIAALIRATISDCKTRTAPPGIRMGLLVLGRLLLTYAVARLGSSTIEKRTAPRWRFSSETARQASSASLRVPNGPCTCAEPSTSLWKFIEPNSPPITQKLLPFVMLVSCCLPLAELVHRVVSAARLQRGFTGEIFLVLVADIGAGHVLMLGAGDTLTDLLALNVLHVPKHAL